LVGDDDSSGAPDMNVGLSTYDIAASELVRLAVAADHAGFESLWLGEHVVLPLDYASGHPTTGGDDHHHITGPIVDPSTTLVDPLVALSACASMTTRIRLATGVFILPLRHPLLTARMTLTIQDVAGGRFMLGVGSGWLREEFDALDVPFGDRASRMDETIDVLRRAWNAETFAHRGPSFSFTTVLATPSPVRVPLILGGNTERALRRAAAHGDGWFSSGTPTLEEAVRLRDRVLGLRAGSGEPPFPVYVRVGGADPEVLARYESEGFDHVVIWADQLWPAEGTAEDQRESFMNAADALGVRASKDTSDHSAPTVLP
jgi:probable F420-dependent oxidoreductase